MHGEMPIALPEHRDTGLPGQRGEAAVVGEYTLPGCSAGLKPDAIERSLRREVGDAHLPMLAEHHVAPVGRKIQRVDHHVRPALFGRWQIEHANAVAALNCRALGAQGGMPTPDEVGRLLVR